MSTTPSHLGEVGSAAGTHPLSTADLSLLVKSVADQPALWAPKLKTPIADRSWTHLHGDDGLDVWLLMWLPGQSTHLHDHGGSSAAFTVLRGLFEEIRPTATGGRRTFERRIGETARIEPGVIHDVRAVHGSPAASIHAYSPPLTDMTYWNTDIDGRLIPTQTVHTHEPEQEIA